MQMEFRTMSRLLAVDDSPVLLEKLVKCLREGGHEVDHRQERPGGAASSCGGTRPTWW